MSTSRDSSPTTQALPLGAYYTAILSKASLPVGVASAKPTEASAAVTPNAQTRSTLAPPESVSPSQPSPPTASPSTSPQPTSTAAPELRPQTPQEKARIVFGSRLLAPQRETAAKERGTVVAGVFVPARPEEPDNCCMSGCVNCVWERFCEEMDEWAAANAEAQKRLAEKGQADSTSSTDASIKDGLGERMDEDALYRDVPVGIREFMKHGKRLKEQRKKMSTQQRI